MQKLSWLIRGIDIAGSAAMLVVLAPSLLLVAAIMKLTSPGPVFCSSWRVTFTGKPYLRLTFCTRHNSFGRFLRRFGLDETPFFVGVLLGKARLMDIWSSYRR